MGSDRPLYPYRPALDGLRGLAVSAVVFFHGGVAALSGGFLGVDTFFVLSGFLITSLLLAEYDRHGRIRLVAFWGRRARRLLPALLVMLATVAIAGSDGARVVLLTASYTRRSERPDGGLYPEDDPARVDAWNALLRQVATADAATVLDLAGMTCPGGTFTWTVNGVRIRSDGLHFTPAGVMRIIAPWLLPQLTAIVVGRA